MSAQEPERERKAGSLADTSLEIEIVVEDPLLGQAGDAASIDAEIVVEDPLDHVSLDIEFPADEPARAGPEPVEEPALAQEERAELEAAELEAVELEAVELEAVELDSVELESVSAELESTTLEPAQRSSVEAEPMELEPRDEAFTTQRFGQADTVRLPGVSGQLGSYRIVRRLGEGGMGQVFEAIDTRNNQRVALKMLFDVEPENVYRLKREFRRMADIVHQNLVTLYELVVNNDLCFFTMEYVPGVDFYTALTSSELYDEQPLRDALRQLVQGVHAIHRAHRVHRDLKPHNVLITPEGRVVILDFGLARDVRRGTLITNLNSFVQGTPAYMSPEQAAGQHATPASDWYAVGVMLYEVITGQLPFSGGVMEILLNKQYEDPIPIAAHNLDIDRELESLVGALMSREPEERPGSQAILAWCSKRNTRRLLTGSQNTGLNVVLFGRERHLKVLETAFEASTTGTAAWVDIHGASGTGRSALLEAFLAPLRGLEDVHVFESRCSERESMPFRALDGIVDGIAAKLRRLSRAERGAILDSLDRELAALCQIFPVLSHALSDEDDPVERSVDASTARQLAFSGLKLLLQRLSQLGPTVLAIDDLHRGDVDSARLLVDVLSPPSAPALLVLCTYETRVAESSPILNELDHLRSVSSMRCTHYEVETGALDEQEASELASRLMGVEPGAPARARARAIAKASGGNPMLVKELSRESARALFDHYGDNTSTIKLDPDVLLSELVDTLLRDLHPGSIELLRLVAVSRGLLELDVAGAALRDASELRTLITQLRGRRLLKPIEVKGRRAIKLYHQSFGRVIVDRIAPEERQAYHASLGEALLERDLDEFERLAYHFSRSGELDRAAEYAAQGAQAAEQSLAFDRAADLYRLAIRCRPDYSSYHRRCAEVLVLAGHSVEAAEHYLAAGELAGKGSAHELRIAAAEQYLICGDVRRGVEVARPLLEEYKLQLPPDAKTARASLRAAVRELSERGLEHSERSEFELHRRELDRLDLVWVVGRGLMLNDPTRGGDFITRATLLALETGEPRRLARCLALMALVARGYDERLAEDCLARAESLARELRFDYGVGLASICRGVHLRVAGSWNAALVELDFGVGYLRERCVGCHWEYGLALRSILGSLEARGEIRSLAHQLQVFLQRAQEGGNPLVSAMAAIMSAIPLLASGRVANARERVRSTLALLGSADFNVQQLQALKIEVMCELYEHRPEVALALLREAWPRLEAAGFFSLATRRTEVLLLRARTIVAVLAARDSVEEDRELLATLESDLARLDAETPAYVEPLTEFVRAGLHAIRGERDMMLISTEAALAGFESAEMKLMSACARWCLGQWLEGEHGGTMIRDARAFMSMQQIADHERWVELHAPGLALCKLSPPAEAGAARELEVEESSPQTPADPTLADAPEEHRASTTRALFLGINESDSRRDALEREIEEVGRILAKASLADRLEIVAEWAVGAEDLQEHLLRHQPEIVHISASEVARGSSSKGASRELSIAALAGTFRLFADATRCVIIDRVDADELAPAIAAHVDYVVGMSPEMDDEAVAAFSTGFYRALAFDCGYARAYELGCNQMALAGYHASTPALHARPA